MAYRLLIGRVALAILMFILAINYEELLEAHRHSMGLGIVRLEKESILD
ncbi:MAG: hypothetical protein M0Z31_07615 [Clostridia bacterium]|nr:hypothetical protein [Clostridia bacterium]